MNESDSEDEKAVEDEDSNDEGNWRNDYPDEDEMDSISERDMRRAMKDFDIDNELSSDDSDHNGFVYSVDAEAFSFEDDLDYCDVNRYGEAYARYKKRVIRELEGGESDDSNDSDENHQQQESQDGSFHSD